MAIAMPLTVHPRRAPLTHLFGLVAVAGLPASLGSIVGSRSVAPAWSALAFGAAAGALAQVVWTLRPSLITPTGPARRAIVIGLMVGVGLMYGTGLLTG